MGADRVIWHAGGRMKRAAVDLFRIMATMPPDFAILAALVCLVAWGLAW